VERKEEIMAELRALIAQQAAQVRSSEGLQP
jgi:hypothetical protein